MATPYLTTPEAKATARRLEKYGLLNANLVVQLLPATLPGIDSLHYVLRYYASEDAAEPLALVHFMQDGKKSNTTNFIDQLQQIMQQEEAAAWGWGEFKPNSMLVGKLPTLANTRRYKLQLLIGAAV